MNSDIDLFIVITDSSKRLRERINEFYQKVEETLGETQWLLSPLILTEKEAKKFNPLYLDILEHHIVLFDNGFFRELTEKLQKAIEKGEIGKKNLSGYIYWVVKNEEKISL